jgi:cardiolipin synthase
MLEAIEAARSHVHLETYTLRSDATGQRFLQALTERARAGVEVRVLYDAVGSRGLQESATDPLRRAGGEIVAFNPLSWLSRLRPRRRDHRKILVVDGQIGFTGGLNIGDEYAFGLEGGEAGWRDAHLRLEGPAVRDLEALFLESWFRADAPDLPWQLFLDSAPSPCGEVRCAVVPDGPVYRRRRTRDLLIAALDNASRYARLASPYFAPGRRVLDALSRASERGVAVDLVLAGRTDHPVLRRAAHSILPRLLARGTRVYEYQQQMMHAKMGSFDDQWAIIGTSNMDRQSFEHSFEVNVIFEGGEIPRRLNARFEDDLAHSREIDAQALAARGPLERILDRLASLVLFLI